MPSNASAERSVSIWMDTATIEARPPLPGDATCDVAVLGAGIAGLSTAYELAKAGRRVVVIDRGPIGLGQSARTTGHVASELDDYFYEVIRLRGEDEARRYYESLAAALDRIEAITADEGIDCDFARVDGFLFHAPGTDRSMLDREFEACHRIGFAGVGFAERAPVPGRDTGRALRFPRQVRFHILKYLQGLVRCIERDGGQVFSQTAATATEESEGGVAVETERGTIRAQHAVVATNSPVSELQLHAKQAPYRTYAITGRVPAGAVDDALMWDTLEFYHYVRLQPMGDGTDALIVGGEDHKSGEAHDHDARFARLEAWTREHYPMFQGVERRWSGQVMEPVDALPFTGLNHGSKRIYIHSGDSGDGLSNGVAGALVLRDLILKGASRASDAFSPGRVSVRSGPEFLSEQKDVVTNLVEHVTGGEVGSVDDLAPGQGALVRQGLKKLAAYRDQAGTLHVRSATCTHAGCVVQWNGFERCWDCPCHGSQFGIDGSVLNGPALTPLGAPD